MAYASPTSSRSRVDRAGRVVGTIRETVEDVIVLENWRASHAHILNTFKQLLYVRAQRHDVIIAQRLKRRPTIVNKLQREPGMNLSRMHDIAGCRVICPSMTELEAFRAELNAGRFNHKRRNMDGRKYNYINFPKNTGYRGIHDVFVYEVEPRKFRAYEAQPWNGMQIEIQYRTLVQHAWATAVEVAGLITVNNPKFDQGSEEYLEFFRISSEMLARVFEASTSCYPEMSNSALVKQLDRLEEQTHIMRIFRGVNTRVADFNFKKTSILIFYYGGQPELESSLQVRTYESVTSGIVAYNSLEKELAGRADIVLVGAGSKEGMQSAFRNYFADTHEFIQFLNMARTDLSGETVLEQA